MPTNVVFYLLNVCVHPLVAIDQATMLNHTQEETCCLPIRDTYPNINLRDILRMTMKTMYYTYSTLHLFQSKGIEGSHQTLCEVLYIRGPGPIPGKCNSSAGPRIGIQPPRNASLPEINPPLWRNPRPWPLPLSTMSWLLFFLYADFPFYCFFIVTMVLHFTPH